MNGANLTLFLVGFVAFAGSTRVVHDLDIAAHQRMFGHPTRCLPRSTGSRRLRARDSV